MENENSSQSFEDMLNLQTIGNAKNQEKEKDKHKSSKLRRKIFRTFEI